MTRHVLAALVIVAAGSYGCSGVSTDPQVTTETLPEIRPNLPPVPALPPPPHPSQYPDSSYSIYGLRHRISRTIDQEVQTTAYIVDIYRPPECPHGQTCPAARMPHIWIADDLGEQDATKRMRVAGYAENQQMIDEAIADAQSGHPQPPPPEGVLPIPTDFVVGAKVRIRGQFTRVSGTGFADSQGMIDYRGHEILVPAPGGGPTAQAPTRHR